MVALALPVLAACESGAAPDTAPMVAAEATTQPASLVDLTVYYRHGRGADAYLVPVTHEVPVSDDLPRTALELLVEGPPSEANLRAVLPAETRVQDVSLDGDTAVVDLSREVVTHAGRLARRPEHEALALAAIVDTLTEFPDISRVRLTVDGRAGGRFWGAWGLPDVLVRDEQVIEPQSESYLAPQPAGFSRREQRLGLPQRRLPMLTAVRVRPSATFLRVSVEITSPQGGSVRGPVPPARVRRQAGDIVLTVRGVPTDLPAGDLSATFRDPAVPAAHVRVLPEAVVVRITPDKPRPFKLHTLSEPSRVVLDIRR